MLSSPNLQKTIAHELGHYVLGHAGCVPNAVTQAEWQRGQEQKELDANAKAVEMDQKDPVAVAVPAEAAESPGLDRSGRSQEWNSASKSSRNSFRKLAGLT